MPSRLLMNVWLDCVEYVSSNYFVCAYSYFSDTCGRIFGTSQNLSSYRLVMKFFCYCLIQSIYSIWDSTFRCRRELKLWCWVAFLLAILACIFVIGSHRPHVSEMCINSWQLFVFLHSLVLTLFIIRGKRNAFSDWPNVNKSICFVCFVQFTTCCLNV
jgi:hypothetical protein